MLKYLSRLVYTRVFRFKRTKDFDYYTRVRIKEVTK
jgi:hypothetical protein